MKPKKQKRVKIRRQVFRRVVKNLEEAVENLTKPHPPQKREERSIFPKPRWEHDPMHYHRLSWNGKIYFCEAGCDLEYEPSHSRRTRTSDRDFE